MAKKGLRKIIVSVPENIIDSAMTDLGYRVGSVGGGSAEYEGMTLLSDKEIRNLIGNMIQTKLEIIRG